MTASLTRSEVPAKTQLPAPDGPILLATDGSVDAALAATAAAQLAPAMNAGVHIVHCWMPVVTPYRPAGVPTIDTEIACEEPAAAVLDEVVARLQGKKARIDASHLLQGRAADLVPELASTLSASLIVIGSRGLGAVRRLALGSVSEGIVHTATTPVLVIRGGSRAWPPRQIIVGEDGSAGSRFAALTAAYIARATGAQLRIVTVIPRLWDEATSPGQAQNLRAATAAASAIVGEVADEVGDVIGFRPTTSVLVGEPAPTLVVEALKGRLPATLAVGSRGLGAVLRLALGSVSTNILRAAPGPVLVCPMRGSKA